MDLKLFISGFSIFFSILFPDYVAEQFMKNHSKIVAKI